MADLKAELDAKDLKIRQLQDALVALATKCSPTLVLEVETAVKAHLDQHIAEGANVIAALRKQCREKDEELAALREDHAGVLALHDKLQAKRTAALARCLELVAEGNRVRAQAAALEQERDKLKTEMLLLRDAQGCDVRSRAARADAACARTADGEQLLATERARLQTQRDSGLKVDDAVFARAAERDAALRARDMAMLERDVAHGERIAAIKEWNAVIRELHAARAQLQAAETKSQDLLQRERAQIKLLQNELHRLSRELNVARVAVPLPPAGASSSARLHHNLVNVDAALRARDNALARLSTAMQYGSAVAAERDRLAAALQEARSRLVAHEDELKRRCTELEELRTRCDGTTTTLQTSVPAGPQSCQHYSDLYSAAAVRNDARPSAPRAEMQARAISFERNPSQGSQISASSTYSCPAMPYRDP